MTRCVAGDPRVDAGADASCRSAEALVAAGAAPRQLSDAQVLNSQQHTVVLDPRHKTFCQQSCASCRTAARSAVLPRSCTLHAGRYATCLSAMIRRCHADTGGHGPAHGAGGGVARRPLPPAVRVHLPVHAAARQVFGCLQSPAMFVLDTALLS
jgi:hypothetical protein